MQEEKERKSGAVPNPIQEETLTQEEAAADTESEIPGAEFTEELYSLEEDQEPKTEKQA